MKIDAATPPQGSVRDWLEHRAATAGDAVSHSFPEGGASLTWAGLKAEAQEIAGRLAGLGAKKGESVALMLPNGRAAVVCFFGALWGGYRATMINLIAGEEAIRYTLAHSEARFVFVGEDQGALWSAARPEGGVALEVGEKIAWPAGEVATPAPVSAEDDALLMYTSGTTGRPKGVVHSNASLLAGGWTPTLAHDLTPEDRALCVLPMYHINGLCVTIMGPLVSGGSVAITPRFSASRFWRRCAETEATWFSVVPTIVSHLVHGDGAPDEATRARLRFARCASSALAPEVQTAFEQRFNVPIVETMGLTETAAQILSNPLPPGVRKIGSPGVAIGNECAIMSPEMAPLGPDQEGEIAVRGPNVMRGYLRNEEATKAALTEDGWFRTGDLGRIDADGYIFVTGRLKELIIKGGENIAPREIDEALYSHSDVVEAAAFGRPCPVYGERVEAAVALRADSDLETDELIEICRKRLGDFKTPEAIYVLDELPKGPSGKIQRLKLHSILSPGSKG